MRPDLVDTSGPSLTSLDSAFSRGVSSGVVQPVDKLHPGRAGFLALIIVGSVLTALRAQSDLALGFRNVPSDARLRMYWRVFGPAWTRPEIDRQLAIIKAVGLGGVTVYFLYPVALDDPGRGIVNERFGSPEFLRDFGYAARKAASLGLRFSVNGGTGWPYGGPTVTPYDAAQRLREVRVAAGKDPEEALRLAEGEHLVAAFVDGRDMTATVLNRRPTDRLTGELRAYISGPTGMQVKRASFGGEGAVLNHYDASRLTKWLETCVKPLLDAAPGKVEGIGCDSLEVYHSNWTDDLPQEFKKRRGYDIIPHLPELFDDAAATSRGLRFDFWRTLAELTEERFTRTLGQWCDRHGVKLEMEPYGSPPNPMTAAANIAIPTGEHYEWKGFAVQRYVASMAHINGKPVIGAEAWTWAGLPNRLGDSLSDIKLVSDMTFLLGANDLTGVDFPYSPESAGSPGWMPYYGPVMGVANPQWKFFPALAAYLNRCQWMLRQGEPVRKIGVYLPVEDAFSAGQLDQMLLDFAVRDRLATGHPTSEFGLKNGLVHHSDLLHGLIRAGYDFDGLDFWAVTRLGRTKGARLEVGKAAYEAIVLPNLELMETDAMERIAAFCQAGGTVVASGRLPGQAPGFGREGDGEKLLRLLADVFGPNPIPGRPHPCGRGRGIFVATAGDAAPALERFVVSNVIFTPRPETVGFVHRRVVGRDIYFFANVGPDDVRLNVEFPGGPRRIEIWDAMDGTIRLAAAWGSKIEIAIPARGSIFVVAGGETPDALPPHASVDAGTAFATAIDKSGQPGSAGSAVPARESKSGTPSFAHGRTTDLERIDLNLGWSLTFEGPDAPPPAKLQTLMSWTELPGGRFFSGSGIYRASFDWPGPVHDRCVLRFEQIREAAEVKLNGRVLGVLFNPPWAVDIAGALRQGRNDFEITVVNLSLNRFLGLPDEDLGPLRARFGVRFSAPEEKKVVSEPWPSGLIGRVWLEFQPGLK